jgi:hypothetical protein
LKVKPLATFPAAIAVTLATVAAAAQFQYTTPVPPGIAIPKEVRSPFGTLKFFDGVPDEASTQKTRCRGDVLLPGKAWFTILRLYGPLEPWFKKTWRPDDIKRVK